MAYKSEVRMPKCGHEYCSAGPRAKIFEIRNNRNELIGYRCSKHADTFVNRIAALEARGAYA